MDNKKPVQNTRFILLVRACLIVLLISITSLFSSFGIEAQIMQISRELLLDKIKGGWAGQMIGVSYGAPTEFRAQGRIYEEALEWRPEMIENALNQDDLYVEITFASVLDKIGLNATTVHFGEAFRTTKYPLWHANAAARKNLNRGIQAPWSGHPKYNFHANDIDFQIESDFIGLMCPALPATAIQFADRIGRVMNYGDGLYGGMFVSGMYAAAFIYDDPILIVKAGLACIPPQSEYAQVISDLLYWYEREPHDWRLVWRKIVEKWDKDDICPDGAFSAFNIDAKLNGAFVAIGLLYGNCDFERTMEIATRCGQDSDCNPSTAAGILGTILGYSKIPQKFIAALPQIAKKPFAYTEYSFDAIVSSTEKRALELIRTVGGQVADSTVFIPIQQPVPPSLESWSPGKPDRFIPVTVPEWKWKGKWIDKDGYKISEGADNEATLEFEGKAIVIIGRLSQKGGSAKVFIDGVEQTLLLDAYIVPNTYDNILWQSYGLENKKHTLQIITLANGDIRSKGCEIPIRGAITYK